LYTALADSSSSLHRPCELPFHSPLIP
jgi:hypothetical protein